MESEGPYTIDSKGEIWWILFDGEKVQTAPKDLVCYSTLVCSLLNTAYAEGRKSMEKEFSEKENHEMKEKCSASWNSGFDQCMQLMKRELGWQEAQNEKRENEFKELLDLANNLRKFAMGNFEPEAKEFDAWKKARGIE